MVGVLSVGCLGGVIFENLPTTVIGRECGIAPNRAYGTSKQDFSNIFVHFSHLLRPV